MTGFIQAARAGLSDDSGVTAVEYAMMLALVIVVLVSGINAVGGTAMNIFQNDATQISNAIGGS